MLSRKLAWLLLGLAAGSGTACSRNQCQQGAKPNACAPAVSCPSEPACKTADKLPAKAKNSSTSSETAPSVAGRAYRFAVLAKLARSKSSAEPPLLPPSLDVNAAAPKTPAKAQAAVPARPVSLPNSGKPDHLPDPPSIGNDEVIVNKLSEAQRTPESDLEAMLPTLWDRRSGSIQPAFAPDYGWIVGQLEYLHSKKQWRVRYAPCDVDDLHGGVVVLNNLDESSDAWRDGMPVKVVGQIIEPNDRKASAEYYVYRLQEIK